MYVPRADMYLVNISFFVTHSIAGRWLDIVKGHLLPLLDCEGFGPVTFSRVLREQADDQVVYSLLVPVDGIPEYQRLTGDIFDRYLSACVEFPPESALWMTTLMKPEDVGV